MEQVENYFATYDEGEPEGWQRQVEAAVTMDRGRAVLRFKQARVSNRFGQFAQEFVAVLRLNDLEADRTGTESTLLDMTVGAHYHSVKRRFARVVRKPQGKAAMLNLRLGHLLVDEHAGNSAPQRQGIRPFGSRGDGCVRGSPGSGLAAPGEPFGPTGFRGLGSTGDIYHR